MQVSDAFTQASCDQFLSNGIKNPDYSPFDPSCVQIQGGIQWCGARHWLDGATDTDYQWLNGEIDNWGHPQAEGDECTYKDPVTQEEVDHPVLVNFFQAASANSYIADWFHFIEDLNKVDEFKSANPTVQNVNIRTQRDEDVTKSTYNQVGDAYLFYLRHASRFEKSCVKSFIGIDKNKCSADLNDPVNAPVIMTDKENAVLLKFTLEESANEPYSSWGGCYYWTAQIEAPGTNCHGLYLNQFKDYTVFPISHSMPTWKRKLEGVDVLSQQIDARLRFSTQTLSQFEVKCLNDGSCPNRLSPISMRSPKNRFYYSAYGEQNVFQIHAPIEDYPYTVGDYGFPGFGSWEQREPFFDGPYHRPSPNYCWQPRLV